MRIDTSYLDLVDATLGYDNAAVLTNVNLTISAGEFIGIVGPNGSGKSTLVKSFVGLADQLQGEFSAFGLDASSFKQRWRIGYVPQHLTPTGVLPATVEEVVASGRIARARWYRPPSRADRNSVSKALERVGLGGLARKVVHQLSGGQQRRVLIARALVSETELLLLDEPTAGIDVEAQAALAETLAQLASTGTTIVLVTHDLGPFEPHLTRVVWVNHGRIEYDGPPTQSVLTATSEPFAHHHDGAPERSALPPRQGTVP
jgi:zinc transport system ATP-binding protein